MGGASKAWRKSISLRKRFGLPSNETTKDTRIVVVEMGGATVGITVDGVSEVLRGRRSATKREI
ncbi:MAG: hypothetical protein FJ030_06820 [Chloroflexi bacterium]|nr:hypothetical protein [Chloroflexota bacterium]